MEAARNEVGVRTHWRLLLTTADFTKLHGNGYSFFLDADPIGF